MVMVKNLKKEIRFHLLIQIFLAVFVTLASYVYIPFGNLKGVLVYIVHFLLLHFSLFGFIYILSFNKRIFSLLFPLLTLIVCSFSFWAYTQDITIDIGLLQAVLETKADIAIDVISFPLILFVITALIVSLRLVKRRNQLDNSKLKSPLTFIAIVSIASFFIIENQRFGVFKRRLPYNIVFSYKKYLEKPTLKLLTISDNITSQSDSLHIVLVVGEAVRSDHLQLNGYDRETNPLLSKQNNLISFKGVYTPLTYTGISLPQILTDQSIHRKKTNLYSFYDILSKGGFKSTWIGNQSLEKSYEKIVKQNDTVILIDPFHSVLSFRKKRDENLLDVFDSIPANSTKKITTFHMIGSHWYYPDRYDDLHKKFLPEADSKYVGSLSKEQLINSYDNTILYLDNFLNNLINTLKAKKENTLLIYLSDHGEILGENGKWFHAQEHPASTNPAMLIWYSDKFFNKNSKIIDSLSLIKNDSITTDFLYHSLLDLGKIVNLDYDKSKSIFSFQE